MRMNEMRKSFSINWLLLSLLFISLFICHPSPVSANDELNVIVGLERASVRKAPSFMSPVLTTLPYGTQVKIIEKKKGWVRTTLKGVTGWMHSSSFAKSDSVLRDIGRGDAAAKSSYANEVAAAGKGFNPEFEATYRAENPTLDYASVDRLESRMVSPAELSKFARDGQLKSPIFTREKR